MCQQYRLPGSKGSLVHTGYIPSVVEWIVAYMVKFGVLWFPETKASLCQIMIIWQSRPCTVRNSNIGFLDQRAILVHTGYKPSVVEWIVAYMAKFGVLSFPETKASLWQIMILWQSRPCTVSTSNIGSLGRRAIWYTQVTYSLLWNE